MCDRLNNLVSDYEDGIQLCKCECIKMQHVMREGSCFGCMKELIRFNENDPYRKSTCFKYEPK